jgi:serine/threonine protein kinase
MAIGQYPYEYNFPTYYSYLKNILDSPEPNIPENLPFSNNLRDFIKKTVCKDPMGRLSI